MNYRYILAVIVTICASITILSCDDEVTPIEDMALSRELSPGGLQAFIRNNTIIELQWNVREGVSKYVVEFSEDSLAFNSIIFTDEVSPGELPYQHGFSGETRYSARVKAVGADGAADSKWSVVTIATAAENIFFLPVPEGDLGATQVTLRWPANSEATHIVVTPGDIQYALTDDDKAAGTATVTGLTGETAYTAKLMNNTKTRGTATFTTLIDLGGALAINPGDDLVAILDAAEEGAAYVIFPGEYDLGSYALTKSVKLSGYLSSNKPVIYGQFSVGTTVASVELKSIHFRGDKDPGAVLAQFFNTASGCNLSTLTVDDCEISNYGNQLIYNNASGAYGDVTFSNVYVHDIPGGGGDGIDFRGGSINSLTVENSTFANAFRTFLRMQVACNAAFRNNTFYKISLPDNSNNNGLFRMNKSAGGTFEVSNCLFVETGVQAPNTAQAGNFCRQDSYMVDSPTYDNNNIHNGHNLLAGLYTTAAAVDATELDPQFVDAANGDFTVTNQTIIDNNIGDPRWLD